MLKRIRYCPGSGQELLPALSVIEVCQDSGNFLMIVEISFVDDRNLVEVNEPVVRPSMIANSRAFAPCLLIPDMFFFPPGKGSACFANIVRSKSNCHREFYRQHQVAKLIGVMTQDWKILVGAFLMALGQC